MTVSIIELRRHLSLTDSCDEADELLLQKLLDAATERIAAIVDSELVADGGQAVIDLAAMQLCTFWYENRDGVRTIPDGVRDLISPYWAL